MLCIACLNFNFYSYLRMVRLRCIFISIVRLYSLQVKSHSVAYQILKYTCTLFILSYIHNISNTNHHLPKNRGMHRIADFVLNLSFHFALYILVRIRVYIIDK
jgi:hypothetical protein